MAGDRYLYRLRDFLAVAMLLTPSFFSRRATLAVAVSVTSTYSYGVSTVHSTMVPAGTPDSRSFSLLMLLLWLATAVTRYSLTRIARDSPSFALIPALLNSTRISADRSF